MIGFANILLKNKAGNLKEQDLACLSRIQENGTHLLTLINSVLPGGKKVPVMMLTGERKDEDVRTGLELGAPG